MSLVWQFMAPKPHLYFLECAKTAICISFSQRLMVTVSVPTQGWYEGEPPRGRFLVALAGAGGRAGEGHAVVGHDACDCNDKGRKTSPGHGPELRFPVPRATQAQPPSQTSLQGGMSTSLPPHCQLLAFPLPWAGRFKVLFQQFGAFCFGFFFPFPTQYCIV